jgi:hypothetical protein
MEINTVTKRIELVIAWDTLTPAEKKTIRSVIDKTSSDFVLVNSKTILGIFNFRKTWIDKKTYLATREEK